MNTFKSTTAKVASGFIAGAILVGGISHAANNSMIGTKACVDNRTGAMYLAKGNSCSASRTLTSISGGSIDVAAIAAAALHDRPVFEYPPLRVKQAVVGAGRASKEQMQFAVMRELGW
mgnify:CR=1 FL=1